MKINCKAVVLALIVFAVSSSAESLISDFISSARNLWPKTKDLSVDQEQKTIPAIQYELPAENEEFLKKGLELIDSPRNALDLCTHRVVLTLKKNCNQLSLEEIGKLAVMMLNCQLEIEGRATFSCKPEMTLKQCTMGMNKEMHQVYSYMSHRASGICSAMKHDQFRAMTEITVNRLMQATRSQDNAMNDALKNQKRVNEMEMENMRTFTENDVKIKEAQVTSLEKLKYAENLIDDNLINLKLELELRQKSEEKLVVIEKSADEITSKLDHHKEELHESHERLLKDVDEIAANLRKNNLKLLEQYGQTLEFLNQFRSVMLVLSKIANSMKGHIDQILQSFHEIGFEMTAEFVVFMMLNVVYFVCGMVFMLFTEVKGFSKFLLMGLFVFNSIASYFKAEVPLFSVNVFVWTSVLAWNLLAILNRRMKSVNVFKYFQFKNNRELDESDDDDDLRRRSVTPLLRLPIRSVTPQKTKMSPKQKYEINQPRSSLNESNQIFLTPLSSIQPTKSNNKVMMEEDSEINAIFNGQLNQPLSSPTNRPDTPSNMNRSGTPSTLNRPITPAMRRVSLDIASTGTSPNRSGTPFQQGMSGRIQCQALTMKGLQCRNAAVIGLTKCRLHKP